MGKCECVWIPDNCESITLVDETLFAEVEYDCCECRYGIIEGDKFHIEVIDVEGDIHTYLTCDVCRQIQKAMFCGGYRFGCLYEDLADHIAEFEGMISSECLLQMGEKAMFRVIEVIDEYFDERDKDA